MKKKVNFFNVSVILILFLFFLICVLNLSAVASQQTDKINKSKSNSFSAFPILMYNSDTGFGAGGKTVFRNYFKKRENFDLTIFASTKGEQWYAFQFSVPDKELRQGTRFLLAWDVKIEWNKILKSNYFGIGNKTLDNEFQFPREVFKLENILGHALSERIIIEAGFRFSHHTAYDFDANWGTISELTAGVSENQVGLLFINLKLDTRDSYLHPKRGYRVLLTCGKSEKVWGSDWSYTLYRSELSAYQHVLLENHILAGRLWMQQVNGNAPYQELSKIGDSWTARGFKADRYLDKAMALASLEYRFPIYSALGGVVFVDNGRVSRKLNHLTLRDWHANWGWGLRYYLKNFVVRFDMGKSAEGTRIFFQFGHVF